MEMEDELQDGDESTDLQQYYEPEFPGSFGGVRRLGRNVSAKTRMVRNFLSHQNTYTLHKRARKMYPTRRVEVYGVDSQWQADLVDMQHFKRVNKGYGHI